MTQERLEQYGITSDMQVLANIEWVCDVFGKKNDNSDKVLLEKTIRHESHLGNYKDDSKEYGESVAQIDEPTYKWILEKLENAKYFDERELFKKHFGFPLSTLHYEDLRCIPRVGEFLCRMRYRFVPNAIPLDDLGMYKYYKKYWNGEDTENEKGGAATYEKWVRDNKESFFKVGE